MVVGAAQTALDDLANRQVGAEMGAPRALHHRFARGIAIGYHACTEEIPADHRPGRQIPGQRNRIPAAMEARLSGGAVFVASLLFELTIPMVSPSIFGTIGYHFAKLWYQAVPSQEDECQKPQGRPVAHHPSPIMEPRRRSILEAAYHVLVERGYAGASTLEIATRARSPSASSMPSSAARAASCEALIAATAARMQLPLATAEIDDRDGLAAALVRFGTTALGELTSPHVVAINRLAVAEAGRSTEIGEHPRRHRPRAQPQGAHRSYGKGANLRPAGPGDPGRHRGEFFSS